MKKAQTAARIKIVKARLIGVLVTRCVLSQKSVIGKGRVFPTKARQEVQVLDVSILGSVAALAGISYVKPPCPMAQAGALEGDCSSKIAPLQHQPRTRVRSRPARTFTNLYLFSLHFDVRNYCSAAGAGCVDSYAAISDSCRKVRPISSRPFSRQCRMKSSMGKFARNP